MKKYTFVLNFGYAESQTLYYFPFTSLQSYKTAKDALVDLAIFLKEKFAGAEEEKKQCCTDAKAKDSKLKFCGTCGNSLSSKKFEFDGNHFMEWIRDIGNTTNDSLGQFYEEYYDGANRWEPGQLEAPNPRLVYNAEKVIAAAAGYPYDDKRTFEVICKERTKAKTESFSYY